MSTQAMDRPMSDVTNAALQDEIANSLLGDDLEQPDAGAEVSAEDGEQSLEEQIADSLVDEPQAELESDELEAQQSEAETEPGQEQEAQAPIELSPQQIQEGIQQLDQRVNELGLNDEAAASRLAYDLTAPFGSAPDGVDSKALGQTMAKTVLSALQIFEATGGDASKAGAIPQHAAEAFTADFLRAWGLDPRTSDVNPQHFAGVVLTGVTNFLQSVQTYGMNASLDRLNSPAAAEAFAYAISRVFGINQPMTRQDALAMADAGGRFILSTLKKLAAQQAQAQPVQQQRQPRSNRQQTQRSQPGRARGPHRFSSNQDLFDAETLDLWHREHGRL